MLLVWVLFHGLHPLVQVDWGSIEFSRHVLGKELSLLLVDGPIVRNLVVQARSEAILGRRRVDRLLVHSQELLHFNLISLLISDHK